MAEFLSMLATEHCYTTECEYKPLHFTVFVRTGMSGPVGQLCVHCSSIQVLMLLEKLQAREARKSIALFSSTKNPVYS